MTYCEAGIECANGCEVLCNFSVAFTGVSLTRKWAQETYMECGAFGFIAISQAVTTQWLCAKRIASAAAPCAWC